VQITYIQITIKILQGVLLSTLSAGTTTMRLQPVRELLFPCTLGNTFFRFASV